MLSPEGEGVRGLNAAFCLHMNKHFGSEFYFRVCTSVRSEFHKPIKQSFTCSPEFYLTHTTQLYSQSLDFIRFLWREYLHPIRLVAIPQRIVAVAEFIIHMISSITIFIVCLRRRRDFVPVYRLFLAFD